MNDEAGQVRAGEELQTDRLKEFLCFHGFTRTEEISVLQFPAGSSNLTYLVKLGRDEFVLRRPPFGNTVKTAHDMRREYDVLSSLSKVYSKAPKPLSFCNDKSVIGSEFYVMERRRGLIIRGRVRSPHESKGSSQHLDDSPSPVAADESFDSPAVSDVAVYQTGPHYHLDRVNTDQSYRQQVCRSFITNLAHLHSIDYEAAGLGDLGHPEGYARRQVEGWTKRYFAAKTDEHAELESVIKWLNANMPAESGPAIVHNDYKFDNVMLDAEDLTKIVAVLDWEMVTIGDPLMDLGTTLGYWMSRDAGDEMLNMPFNPRILMENISRAELAEMYAKAAGRDLPDLLFYYVFGTFKIAVIAQQIYARYRKGSTKDRRFARFDKFVYALGKIAARTIDQGHI